MNQQALDTLQQRAAETHSDALIVLQHGQTICAWFSKRSRAPIHLMSCTKSIVGLVFGCLLDNGCLTSLDQPVATLYPEWKQGQKTTITIRMLLNHTSGLQNVPNAGLEIEPAPDVVQLALAAELDFVPGSAFSYNNKAVNLLAGVVQRITGQALDQYVSEVLFAPLAITEYEWLKDRSGTPYVMAGLSLPAADFARIGQVVAQTGRWEGKSVVSAAWVEELLKQSQPYRPRHGLLWWRLLDEENGQVEGYYSEGWLGQYLVILPQEDLVAVRLVRPSEQYDQATDTFADFLDRVRALT